MIYFSKSTNGFYDSNIHIDLPTDVVGITTEIHKTLLDGQSVGKVIAGDAKGRPILTDPPPPTLADKTAHLAQVRWEAEISGTTWNDHMVETDREAQGKYTSELTSVLTGVREDPSGWKLGGQFVLLSNADLQAVAIAARAHVMACFAAEATVQSSLADLPTLDAVRAAFTQSLKSIKGGGNT